ncbi:MAG: hypothetical protein AAB253_06740, partial [candidate division NC10 bacterium]
MRDRTRDAPSEKDLKSAGLTPDDLAALDPKALLLELQETARRLDAAFEQLEHAHQQNERLVAALT